MTTTSESRESSTNFSIGVVDVADSSSYREWRLVLTVWQDDGQKITELRQLDLGPVGTYTVREQDIFGTYKCSMKENPILSLLFPVALEPR